MKRLLCLISCMNAGGAETFLMKLYRSLDRSLYQIDFCINEKGKSFYEDEIISMGGRIFRIPSKSESTKEFRRELGAIVRENKYESVLRVTSNAMGFMDLKIAKKSGAKLCVARSSNSGDGGGLKVFAAHRLGRLLYGRYVDVKIAPSDLAAKYTFGRKAFENGEVTILHNAVNLDVFHYDASAGKSIREEFGIAKDKKVIGHIGRFNKQKNHRFLLNVFAEYVKSDPEAILLLVGQGELEGEIREQAEKLKIADKTVLTGVRSDIPGLLSAMDVFLFPSLYEGMPNTVIEAQATGLPCVISDAITREADITGLVKYVSLNEPCAVWAERVLSASGTKRRVTHDDFINNHYDIKSVTDDFVSYVFYKGN